MVTKTDQEKRFFDLTAQSIELVNQGKRSLVEIEWLNQRLQQFKERTFSENSCHRMPAAVMYYAYGSKLSPKRHSRVAEHLKGCPSCSDLVLFIQKTRALTLKEPIHFDPPTEPCLTTDAFMALDEGTLDEEATRKARRHLLACPQCREIFLKLRVLDRQLGEEEMVEILVEPPISASK
jgi:Zn finger protein HypA/HybF involved in hydrogenase expression